MPKLRLTILSILLASGSLLAEELERSLLIEFESPLLATRGDAELGHLGLAGRMMAIPEADRAGVVSDPGRIAELLNDVLLTRKLGQDAIADGVLEDPAVQAELYHLIMVRLSEKQRQRVAEQTELDDYTQQAREIYLKEKANYQTEPTVSFTHLLLQSDSDNDEQVEQRARELLAEIKAGASLEDYALEFSQDPSVTSNKGRFEDAPMGRLESGFKKGIESMTDGQIELIKSGYGWHIVRIDALTPARQQSFDEVSDTLKKLARQRHVNRVWDQHLREFYSHDLVIEPNGVAEILDRYQPTRELVEDIRADKQ
ncbi:MAG: peptidylprolyl isomerase [Xanthomonadales bacterium]|nr:peptidylprolyl isomerase [Xanthomonadales bacterium]